jgi:putative Ca2+/H+ antiporter (TMEM165/GDT1 family)
MEDSMGRLFVIALTIFIAELGDKTQIATALFASERENAPLAVFAASAFALVLASAVAVAIGTLARDWLQTMPLKLFAGIAFVAIGIWSIGHYFRGL